VNWERDVCPTCGTAISVVNDDDVWIGECELGHLIELEDDNLTVRLLALAFLFLAAAWIEVPL
jgi:hypothetical protein